MKVTAKELNKLIKTLDECKQEAIALKIANDRLAQIEEVNNIVEALNIL